MIFKVLKYIVLTAINPKYYLPEINENKKKNTLANISFIISTFIIFILLLLGKYETDKILFSLFWTFGFILSMIFKIYLISMLISKLKHEEISFKNAKLIIAFTIFPIIILISFKTFFPYTELADFYNIIFFSWYIILIAYAIIHIYSVKIKQAIMVIFNIILIYGIIFFIFSGIIL